MLIGLRIFSPSSLAAFGVLSVSHGFIGENAGYSIQAKLLVTS